MPSSIYGYDFDHELIDFLIPGDSLDNASVDTNVRVATYVADHESLLTQ